jgi:hypothetical protein
MRHRSPEYGGRERATAAGMMRVVAALSGIGLGLGSGLSNSAAQGAASDVAYVEAVSGRVLASTQESPTQLDVLDIIGDRTRLDLPANSELRLCHYRMRKLVTLRGPLRASISAAGVTAESGKTIAASAEACAEPVVSTFQGGVVSRNIAVTVTQVPLRPIIKVVNQGSKTIRQISLWDSVRQKALATFEHNTARPSLEEGQSYLLVVERGDGSELKMLLQASAGVHTGPLIVVAR